MLPILKTVSSGCCVSACTHLVGVCVGGGRVLYATVLLLVLQLLKLVPVYACGWERHTDRQRSNYRQHTDRQTDRHTDKQTDSDDRDTQRQTERERDRDRNIQRKTETDI